MKERESARPGRRRGLGTLGAEVDGPAVRLSEVQRGAAFAIRSRPLSAIAAAVGVGFVLGGALSFRPGRIALAAIVRQAGRELLQQLF